MLEFGTVRLNKSEFFNPQSEIRNQGEVHD